VATDQAVPQFQLLSRWTSTPLIFERTVKTIPHVPRGFLSRKLGNIMAARREALQNHKDAKNVFRADPSRGDWISLNLP
jgi:hypothetical protein